MKQRRKLTEIYKVRAVCPHKKCYFLLKANIFALFSYNIAARGQAARRGHAHEIYGNGHEQAGH